MTKKNITIIDADSIVYILAYALKDRTKVTTVVKAKIAADVDGFIRRILADTSADEYLGYFGTPGGKKCFRFDVAETIGYKHSRKPKEDWFKLFQPRILKQLEETWKFEGVEGYEADDYVCQAAAKFRDEGHSVTVAAVDKDIRQLTGVKHYEYNPSGLVSNKVFTQTDAEAFHQLYFLMIAGDTSDGYKGIPGVGKKGANEILEGCKTEVEFEKATKEAYEYWFTEGLLEKQINKTLKEQYDLWKVNNPGKRLTKAIKEEEILPDLEDIFKDLRTAAKNPKNPTWKKRYEEMFKLAKLPDTGDYREDIIVLEPHINENKIKTKSTKPYEGIKGMLDNIV